MGNEFLGARRCEKCGEMISNLDYSHNCSKIKISMIKVAFVGHAADKFSKKAELAVKRHIRDMISAGNISLVVSGRCPLGGVDVWTEEIADELEIPFEAKEAKVHLWDPPGEYGFKKRNLDIARGECEVLYNIVVDDYPWDYKGKRYFDYHCMGKGITKHIKSGGCWTAWKAWEAGKTVQWRIFDQDGNFLGIDEPSQKRPMDVEEGY